MARLIVTYKTPADKAAFDSYYFEKHVPLAKKIPGLRKYEVNSGPVMTLQGPSSSIHLVATLHFDSVADFVTAMGSPEGKATAADVPSFAQAGVDMIFFEDKVI
jgi:uncharacterized protein (TIGR02118 family)